MVSATMFLRLRVVFLVTFCALVSHTTLVQGRSPPGCVARMFRVAGVPTKTSSNYELALRNSKVPVSQLKSLSPFLLKFVGVTNAGHASLFHSCVGKGKRSPQCAAFKECSAHGKCELTKRSDERIPPYQCRCKAGYKGMDCQIDACRKTCQNGGSCKRTARGPLFQCVCKPGFKGSKCQIDACRKTCRNGGSCKRTKHGSRFQCVCKAGFNGRRCESTINRCTPNPCANAGRCRSLLNDFVCTCRNGYGGKRCESHLLTGLDQKLGQLAKVVMTGIQTMSKTLKDGFSAMNRQTQANAIGPGISRMAAGIKTLSATLQQGFRTQSRAVTKALYHQTKAIRGIFGPKQKTCARRSARNAFPSSRVYKVNHDFVVAFPFKAYCNMDVQGGGWTVIQRRKDGSVNFQRRWKDYKGGFGSLTGEFWLGLDKIHAMTSSGKYELLIVLRNRAGKRGEAYYSSFRVDGEKNKYKLHVSGFKGKGVQDRMAWHNGMYFTTMDRDNDTWGRNCDLNLFKGGWWYKHCAQSALNSPYRKGKNIQYYWRGFGEIVFTEMMIRRRS